MEIFKDIKNYEGLYQVSNAGKVISLPRTDLNNPRGVRHKARLLKFDISEYAHTSYARVSLCKEGKVSRYLVHRLVAEHFIPNAQNKPEVNHIDNNGLNNHVGNLEWCTTSENMLHCYKQGRCSNLSATEAAKDVAKIIKRYKVKWEKMLGERFLAYYPSQFVNASDTTKATAAVRYLCKCGTERLALTSYIELRENSGICPNCSLNNVWIDEDIV